MDALAIEKGGCRIAGTEIDTDPEAGRRVAGLEIVHVLACVVGRVTG